MVAHAPTTVGRRRRHVALTLRPAGVVAALVAASFFLRIALVFGRELQRYLPDEYLYGQLARSLAEGRGARVLGEPVALPTLLQPILTAPAWLFGDPELAFRLTQGANAAAMSLGAVVVFLLARELGVPAWSAVGAAAVALASPDLLYAGYVTADAFGYLGSTALLLGKSFGKPNLPWLSFFQGFSYVAALTCLALFGFSAAYFSRARASSGPA